MTAPLRSSVLVPSYRRPHLLARCLEALAAQAVPADEVIVVWQGDDTATRDEAERMRPAFSGRLVCVHSDVPGVVAAENRALEAATGDVVLLIDDDAVAPPDWVARHLSHYADPTVGAVGGPADNHHPGGEPFPRRESRDVGRLTAYGRAHGNMYDHPPAWRARPPAEVDHLVGYNMSLRRAAFDRFEVALRPYWQMFEMDACLQVRSRGYRVLFDFGNVVAHHPVNTAYTGGREGDLQVKIYNAAYNQALILSRHSAGWRRALRLPYLLLVGSASVPGLLGSLVNVARMGHPRREMRIFGEVWRHVREGWRAGAARRERSAAGGSMETRDETRRG